MLSLPGGDAFCNGAKIRIKNDIRTCRFSADLHLFSVIRLRAALSALPSAIPLCHPGFRAGILGCLMLLLCRLAGIHPRLRPAGSRIKCGMTGTVCAAVPSHPSALPPSLSFRPPSRNPGWIYARYCIALPPRHCHPRTCPPRPRVGARGDRQRGKRGDKGLPYT